MPEHGLDHEIEYAPGHFLLPPDIPLQLKERTPLGVATLVGEIVPEEFVNWLRAQCLAAGGTPPWYRTLKADARRRGSFLPARDMLSVCLRKWHKSHTFRYGFASFTQTQHPVWGRTSANQPPSGFTKVDLDELLRRMFGDMKR